MKKNQSKPIDLKAYWKLRKWYLLGTFIISLITPGIHKIFDLEESLLSYLLIYILPLLIFTFIFLRIEKKYQANKKKQADNEGHLD
ncbi:MAG: hypothetical protein ACOYKE_10345 [Ferruginibacter sp.]